MYLNFSKQNTKDLKIGSKSKMTLIITTRNAASVFYCNLTEHFSTNGTYYPFIGSSPGICYHSFKDSKEKEKSLRA